MAADQVLQDVMDKLNHLDADQLEELAIGLTLTVDADKQGKKRSLYNLVSRYLTSEDLENSDDEGQSVFLKVNDVIDAMIDKKTNVKPPVATVQSSTTSTPTTNVTTTTTGASSTKKSNDPDSDTSAPKYSLHKIREFKINGSVGGDAKDRITVDDLLFQMEEGKSLGYSEREVRLGVIRAMKADSKLRNYFQGHVDMDQETFKSILRCNYESKKAQTLMDNMGKCKQEANQDEMAFVVDMMQQRDNILAVTKEEAWPLPENTVIEKFFHAVSVGFRKVAVRLELRPVLKIASNQSWISDADLFKEVRTVMDREKENEEKTGEVSGVNAVEVKTNDCKILKEMGKMHSKMDEMTKATTAKVEVMQNDIELLKSALQGNNIGNNNSWNPHHQNNHNKHNRNKHQQNHGNFGGGANFGGNNWNNWNTNTNTGNYNNQYNPNTQNFNGAFAASPGNGFSNSSGNLNPAANSFNSNRSGSGGNGAANQLATGANSNPGNAVGPGTAYTTTATPANGLGRGAPGASGRGRGRGLGLNNANAGGGVGRGRGGGQGNGGVQPGRRPFPKCPVCVVTNAYCTHCWYCGGDHKVSECPNG